MNYLSSRIQELFKFIQALSDEAKEDTIDAKETLKKLSETEDKEEKAELFKAFKKIQFFNNLKFVEIDRFIPVLVELVNMARLMDIELELTEEQEKLVEAGKIRFKPMYIYDKNELKLLNTEIESMVVEELNNPSSTDLEAISKLGKDGE